jgi:hypothetical protein
MLDAPAEPFDTRAAYLQALDDVLAGANREVCIFDTDLKKLELDTRARSDALAAFLAGGQDRKLRVVVHDLDHLTRYSPRLMTLLKRYSHCFSVRQSPESLRNLDDCLFLVDGVSAVIRFHADFFRGKKLVEQPVEVHDWQQRFEDLWLESLPGASATHIGL